MSPNGRMVTGEVCVDAAGPAKEIAKDQQQEAAANATAHQVLTVLASVSQPAALPIPEVFSTSWED